MTSTAHRDLNATLHTGHFFLHSCWMEAALIFKPIRFSNFFRSIIVRLSTYTHSSYMNLCTYTLRGHTTIVLITIYRYLLTCKDRITNWHGIISGLVQFLDTGSKSRGVHVLQMKSYLNPIAILCQGFLWSFVGLEEGRNYWFQNNWVITKCHL